MIRKALFALQSRLPTRQIAHKGKPYLERSYLGTVLGLRFYLHRFVACDEDGVHDHPFLYSVSLLLAGWYWEDRWALRYRRRWFNLIGPNDMHRVVLPENGKDVWTLFVHSARVKPWGFLRASATDRHGPRYEYRPESHAEDPAYSDWSKDESGKRLRESGKMFPIPLGMNAYAVGLLDYPDDAKRHPGELASTPASRTVLEADSRRM
jgi:hypothetical protein